ncbi:MAG: 16S rRNA (cytosine(1402)-N(4))-methyltransferase RsmH [Paludibacteraceae bacterium]|nr:16S rRNA (cytosine(1402)-N(4))-methyltransferase RsmH [Paludibacteraceae bacterium]
MATDIVTAGRYHIPVLCEQTIDLLQIKPDGTYVDVTFGGGGHSRAIMSRLEDGGRLLGFDQDMDAYNNRIDDDRFIFVRSNFRYISNFLRYHAVDAVDGILADLGVSSHHFDDQTRGFSFRFDGNLDMRMNQQAGKSAADVVNGYSEEALADVFYLYGELKSARKIARAIVNNRSKGAITQVQDLLRVLQPYVGRDKEKKELAQIFQALRIEVNDEMAALQKLLQSSLEALKPGGRMAVLTYHSLEDRLVKNFFRSGNLEGKIEKDFYGNVLSPWKLVNNKVIVADEQELTLNPRSRSAKLRVAEKI